jgi:XTP/dITP diphosphohydrolase
MRDIIFATNNLYKLTEIADILSDDAVVHSPAAAGYTGEIPEDGLTLEENALQKARFIRERTGQDCFADDTGLEVYALDGAPGVFSARYAGVQKSFDDNIDKLLAELSDKTDRRARFRTVIAFVTGSGAMLFEGVAEGEIMTERSGSGGFGYDPVFRPAGYDKTFAEMTLAEKNKISHRALAVKKFMEYLQQENS